MLRIGLAQKQGEGRMLPGFPAWMGRLLNARGVNTEEEARRFLNPALDQLLSPWALHDMEKACAILRRAAEEGQSVVIYGDYDVDGVSASAIMWEALGRLGVLREVYIPDRHKEGYGLNIPAVEELAKKHRVLLTVDCGIASIRETARARELGMRVIVTDHHRHGETLPPADAVISPLLGDYPYPFLCGAGVAWKLALALLGEQAEDLMEIAALATVADMVPLTGENRVITALGLKKAERTGRLGLRAVMNRAGVGEGLSSDQVAFQIAPRMNACGRMASAKIALEMLLTKDEARAEELALEMEGLNQERKNQENRVVTDALSQVEQMNLVDSHAIVVRGEGWNSGVVGLAAGRVAEQYAYPTVALAQEGDMCVGSARSAGNVDIYQALSQCADLFERFGGHKQAAGLTIRAERVEAFARRLSDAVAEQTGGRPILPEIRCDGEMTLGQVTEETVALLSRLEPFGMGNPAPRFLCRRAQPLSMRAVGAEGRHLKCSFRQGNDLRDGIFFGGGEWAGRTEGEYKLAFSPVLNEFRGKVSAECRLYGLGLLPETLPRRTDKEALSLFAQPWSQPCALRVPEEGLEDAMVQGTVLVCRCLDTALSLLKRFPEADFCLDKAEDPRAFPTILLYGHPAAVSPFFRRAVLCDGDAGEGEAWKRALPHGRVEALPLSAGMKALLKESFAGVDALRNAYVALRAGAPRDMEDFGERTGLVPGQAAFALRVLSEISLIDFSFSPFRASLLPMRKASPEESRLFQWMKRAKEG